nr:MAG TPA: hypothetical protein [Crassvirales sp.]
MAKFATFGEIGKQLIEFNYNFNFHSTLNLHFY